MRDVTFAHRLVKACSAILFAGSLFFVTSAEAVSFNFEGRPDVATMLINFSETVPELMRLVTALAYVMGFFFVIKGVMELKQYGESRSMMSQEHGLSKPLTYIMVGALLIYLPGSVQTGLSTFWHNPTPYAYVSDATDSWTEFTNAIFMIIQLIGTIAFIRGLIVLTHIGGGRSEHGSFAKAMAYIISGVFCINLYQFLQAIMTTLGLGTFS
ncbi:MAG: hypothetical protein ACD_60C00127G0005 [uncultured bacterium]|nr:MAG: hypothetical protein ACD_60C00127G0005 [uncultured bacterium]